MAEYLPRALSSKPPSMLSSSPHPNSKTNKENQYVPLRKLSNASNTSGEDGFKNKSPNWTNTITQRRGSSPGLNEMSFHPENTLKNNRAESPDFLGAKYDNLTQSDIKLLHKEMATLKKTLNESQARSVFATKELSKIQYENAALQLQVKKAEAKCKDMIEKHTNSQVRVNELTFINNQLNSENAKLKANAHENSNETKDDLNKLRKSLIQIEDLIQTKNGQVIQYSKNIQKILDTLQKLLEGCNVSLYPKFQASFMQAKQNVQKILKVVDIKYIEGLERDEVRGGEFDAVKSLNEVIVAYEKENGELANEVLRLNEILEQEKFGQAKLTPTYRDALYKLKDAVNIVKNKLKDIQKSKQVEKEYYEGKIQKLREGRDALTQENKALRTLNHSLEAQLKDSDDQVRVLKERDSVKHQQGVKTPWGRGSYKPENKYENDHVPSYRNSYNPAHVAERDGDYHEKDVAAKMYIDGLTERRGSRRNSINERNREIDVNSNWNSQQKNQEYHSGAKGIYNIDDGQGYTKPVNSWREYRKGGDTFRGNQGNYPQFGKGEDEILDQAEGEDKGLRNQIHVLDDEIHRLEECIREELATNEDFAF